MGENQFQQEIKKLNKDIRENIHQYCETAPAWAGEHLVTALFGSDMSLPVEIQYEEMVYELPQATWSPFVQLSETEAACKRLGFKTSEDALADIFSCRKAVDRKGNRIRAVYPETVPEEKRDRMFGAQALLDAMENPDTPIPGIIKFIPIPYVIQEGQTQYPPTLLYFIAMCEMRKISSSNIKEICNSRSYQEAFVDCILTSFRSIERDVIVSFKHILEDFAQNIVKCFKKNFSGFGIFVPMDDFIASLIELSGEEAEAYVIETVSAWDIFPEGEIGGADAAALVQFKWKMGVKHVREYAIVLFRIAPFGGVKPIGCTFDGKYVGKHPGFRKEKKDLEKYYIPVEKLKVTALWDCYIDDPMIDFYREIFGDDDFRMP